VPVSPQNSTGASESASRIEVAECRDQDHRHVRPARAQALAKLQASHAAEPNVGDDHVKSLALDRIEGIGGAEDVHRLEVAAQ
jgi:hypothetical protein